MRYFTATDTYTTTIRVIRRLWRGGTNVSLNRSHYRSNYQSHYRSRYRSHSRSHTIDLTIDLTIDPTIDLTNDLTIDLTNDLTNDLWLVVLGDRAEWSCWVVVLVFVFGGRAGWSQYNTRFVKKLLTLRVSPPAHPKTIARRVALMKDVQQNAVKECNTSVLPPMCSHCSPARCTQYRTRRAQHVPDMWTHWERGRGGSRHVGLGTEVLP